jgi:hypothetical protein
VKTTFRMKTLPLNKRLRYPSKNYAGGAGISDLSPLIEIKDEYMREKSTPKYIYRLKLKRRKRDRIERISSSSPTPITPSEYRGGEEVNQKEPAPVEDEDRWVLRMARLHEDVFSCRAIWEKFYIAGLVHGLLVVVERATGKTLMLASAMSPLGEEWFWPA